MANNPRTASVKNAKTIELIKYPDSEYVTVRIRGTRDGEHGIAWVNAAQLTDALLEVRGISTRWAACSSCGEMFEDHACPPGDSVKRIAP